MKKVKFISYFVIILIFCIALYVAENYEEEKYSIWIKIRNNTRETHNITVKLTHIETHDEFYYRSKIMHWHSISATSKFKYSEKGLCNVYFKLDDLFEFSDSNYSISDQPKWIIANITNEGLDVHYE